MSREFATIAAQRVAFAPNAGSLMPKAPQRKGSGQAISIPRPDADLLGFLKLLKVARVSAEAHCADGTCVALLDECILNLMQKNGVIDAELRAGVSAAEYMQIPTLLRALSYARAEALEDLDEPHSAALIARCISFIRVAWSSRQPESPPPHRLYN